jgi:hypothetical protein
MANETYTLIQKTTLNASAASITFSSIPQTFTDLVVMCSLRNATAGTAQSGWVKFNGSSTGYAHKYLSGDGASASSAGDAAATRIYIGQVDGATATANTFANVSIYIPNYTSANYKSVSIDGVQETNATTAYATLSAGLWSNTAAITSISLETTAGDYVQYSEVSLYGVAKQGVNPVAGPKASGGDIITNDGTYWIHQFLNSGTFIPSQTLSTDYLVVAGGGAGGGVYGGGGGAGGYRTGSLSALVGTALTVTIGAGGAGVGAATYVQANNGSNSVFSSITSTGGGGGAVGNQNFTAGNGGSGGGAAGNGGVRSPGTASPSGQGNDGGTTTWAAPNYGAGGGGGASAAGGGGVTTSGGNGGAGSASSITGTSITRAGGGGGGTYDGGTGGTGSNGGGNGGGGYVAGTNATVNTGSGGGGSGSNASGTSAGSGSGGSGIVIIRYAI